MHNDIELNNSTKVYNFDLAIIFLIPITILLFLFLGINDDRYFYYIVILLSILIYELVVYDTRNLFGFSGIQFLSIPSIIVTTYTCFIALPSINILFFKDLQILSYIIIVCQFYFIFPLGLFTSSKIHKIKYSEISKILQKEFNFYTYNRYVNFILFNLLFISSTIFIIYLIRVDEIPLFQLYKNIGNSGVLWILREESLKLLEISSIERYLFMWQRSLFIPFGLVLSLFYYNKENTKIYLFFSTFFFALGIIFNTLTLEKSPIAALFLIISVFIIILRKKINLKYILLSVVTIFSIPLLISFFYYHGKDSLFEFLITTMLSRIFLIPSEVLYQYVLIFPNSHDFLLGRSTQLISFFHPLGSFDLSNYVAQVWWKEKFTSGYANVLYLGNFWADFGYLGVYISTFILGYIVNWLYSLILFISKYEKNWIYTVSISLFMPILTFNFFSSNITTLFFTRGMILLIIFYYLIMWLEYRRTILNNEK